MSTPWGTVQTQRNIAQGIIEVTTASHGGIHLSPTLNAKVHQAWRDRRGWYEEDCEWAIVALTFPGLFGQPMPDGGQTVAEYADGVARRWMPDQYEKVFGVVVTAEESSVRREQQVAAAVAGEMRSTSAWGHGNDGHGRTLVPKGWVGVAARLGGRYGAAGAFQAWHLVPESEYDDADRTAGTLIDPARHPEWPEVPAEEVEQPVVVAVGGTRAPMLLGPGLYPAPDARNTFVLRALAEPHRGVEVGELWRYPAAGGQAEEWRALRRLGTPAGASLRAHPTREAALDAVGFRPPPYAEVPDAADIDVAAVFAEFLATA